MCHIIVLQLLLTAIIIASVWVAMQYLVRDVSQALITNIAMMLSGGTLTPAGLLSLIDTTTLDQFMPVAVALTAIILCFGFIMAYVALTPTRRSLDRKKRFVNNIAHELRTPLSIIRTNLDVALFSEDMSESVRATLEKSVNELERISKIINNLISLSNLMRTEHMQFSQVDVGTVAQSAVATLEPLIVRKNLTFIFRRNTDAKVFGNDAALEQVAFNLIKNAVSHTDTGGAITVTVESMPQRYVGMSIADTGSGIKHEDFFHIFEPFYRARGAREGGSGLGLAIVNEIVQMHQGKITVRSAPGRGTTVTVMIPRSDTGSDPETAPKQEDMKDGKEFSIDFSRTLFE